MAYNPATTTSTTTSYDWMNGFPVALLLMIGIERVCHRWYQLSRNDGHGWSRLHLDSFRILTSAYAHQPSSSSTTSAGGDGSELQASVRVVPIIPITPSRWSLLLQLTPARLRHVRYITGTIEPLFGHTHLDTPLGSVVDGATTTTHPWRLQSCDI